MKKLASTIAAITLIVTPAFAADMAVKAPPTPAVAAPYNWSGFYVGGTAGEPLPIFGPRCWDFSSQLRSGRAECR